jgi:hypothetical protein
MKASAMPITKGNEGKNLWTFSEFGLLCSFRLILLLFLFGFGGFWQGVIAIGKHQIIGVIIGTTLTNESHKFVRCRRLKIGLADLKAAEESLAQAVPYEARFKRLECSWAHMNPGRCPGLV